LQTKFGRLIVLGLICSLLGDVLLMIRGLDLFIPGLLTFLTAQILYSIAFLSQRNQLLISKSLFHRLCFLDFLFSIAVFMLFIQNQIFTIG
jgi:uncharacterized membrane protein YhhN